MAKQGETLGYQNDTWSNTPTSFTQQWYRDDVAIEGATADEYLLVEDDIDTMIKVIVVAHNDFGSSDPVESAEVGPIEPGVPAGSPWTPAGILGRFWMDAQASGGLLDGSGGSIADGETVGTIVDQFGLRNATQGTDANRAVYQATSGPNSGPCVSTGDTDLYGYSSPPTHSSSNIGGITMYAVLGAVPAAVVGNVQGNVWAGPNGCLATFIRGDNGGSFSTTRSYQLALISDDGNTYGDFDWAGWNIYAVLYNTTSLRHYLNDSLRTTYNANGAISQNSDVLFGNSVNADYFGGKAAEILFAPGKHNPGLRNAISGYLAWHNGLEGNLPAGHPYEFGAPTTGIEPTAAPVSESNSSAGVTAVSPTNPITIPGRADAVAGDLLMIAVAGTNPFGYGVSLSGTGWNYIGRTAHTLAPSGVNLDLWWKEATGAEGTVTATFSTTIPGRCIAKMFRFSGVVFADATFGPIDNEGASYLTGINAGTGATVSTANVEALAKKRLMVNIVAGQNGGQVGSSSNGWSKDYQESNGGSGAGPSLTLFTLEATTAGLKTGNQYVNTNLSFTTSRSFCLIPLGYDDIYYI